MSRIATDCESWIGSSLVDVDRHRIGTIEEIYFDDETGRPQWLFVKTARFGNRHSFVPLTDAQRVTEGIMTPYERREIERAPKLAADDDLDGSATAELYVHYGLAPDALVPIERDGPTPSQRVLSWLHPA